MPIYHIKSTQETIQLAAKPFASGGEGALHQITAPQQWQHCVAKIIYPHKRTTQKEAKLYYLLAHPPQLDHQESDAPIIWVQQLLHDQDGQFVGFLMPRATGEKLEILTAPKLPKHLGPEWERLRLGNLQALRLRLKICYNIAVAVHLLHATNRYVLVDLKPDNILIKSNGQVSIVDTDSVEIIEGEKTLFAATVATPEYTPSEYYRGTQPGKARIDTSWDNFSLAIIFYRLLFGIHPFAATAGAPYEQLTSLGDKIQAGLFVHNASHQDQFPVIPPPHQLFHQQDPSLQALFKQAFIQGHEQPQARPLAATWAKVIAEQPLLLTERILPTERLSLEHLQSKNWYQAAIEQARKSQVPTPPEEAAKKLHWASDRKTFEEKCKIYVKRFDTFFRPAVIALGISYVCVFILMIIINFSIGEPGDDLIPDFLWATKTIIWPIVKSPYFFLFLFSPILIAIFQEALETFFLDKKWQGTRKAKKAKKQLYKNQKNYQEWQYDLYSERSRLNNKIRSLKNEYYVYLKVKQQKEADFERKHRPTIARSQQKIDLALQSKKTYLAQQDQAAKTLIEQEGNALRLLLQQQEKELAADPIYQSIRGNNSTQKLLFLQQDAPAWTDKSYSKAAVNSALKAIHQVQKAARTALKQRYDQQHQQLLQQVEEEKISIEQLMDNAVTTMRERIRVDELLFDTAFRRTLNRMEQLKTEIKLRETALQEVQTNLRKVREELK